MERFEGTDLLTLLKQRVGKLPEEEAAKIIEQILKAVRYFHSKKWIHRDLKPENIMIGKSEDGKPRVKVIDFGVCNQK